MQLSGFHHLTAISARIRENLDFYTRTLGLRLVKRTVNQDDVGAYHLYYADRRGTPGTTLTFFDWPLPPEERGTGSINLVSLGVGDGEALRWWAEHLREEGVEHSGIAERDGRQVLDFQDPEGLRLSLLVDGGAGPERVPWERSPVPAPHQLRGLGPLRLSVPALPATDQLLREVLGLRPVREYVEVANGHHTVVVYEMAEGGAHAELHVAVQPSLRRSRQGAGGVHHLAFRTPNEGEFEGWRERLDSLGIPNSGVVDRFYFQSLYFREPAGILFEIATKGPGFAVDESEEVLGESLVLPPFLEHLRHPIAAGLKPLE